MDYNPDSFSTNEAKGQKIFEVGASFNMRGDLGKFQQGEKVTIESMEPEGEDIKMVLKNEKGVTDDFFIDKNDPKQ